MPCLSDKTFVTPQCDFLVPLHASHPSTSSGRGILATAGCKQSSSTLWVKMATDSFPSLVFVQCDFLVPLHASHPSTSSGRGILATAGCKQSSSTLWVKMATDSFPSLVFVHGCDKSFYQKTSDGSKAPNGSSCDSGGPTTQSAPFSNPSLRRMPGPLRRGRWRPMGAGRPQWSILLPLPA